MLIKLVHHRNMLKHYRSTIKQFMQLFDNSVHLDIDFSQNLSLPLKQEPQSLHWTKQQVTVHSGILKCSGEKTYHPYSSDTLIHEQTFLRLVIEEMLSEVEMQDDSVIIIESDNCTSQYKSSKHFYDTQNIANKYEKTVFRVFGIAGHGKGEVDHVGGIAKVVIRRQIAAGSFFPDSSDMVEFLNEKFKDHDSPRYKFKEIYTKQLEIARNLVKNTHFQGIHGSSHFQLKIYNR